MTPTLTLALNPSPKTQVNEFRRGRHLPRARRGFPSARPLALNGTLDSLRRSPRGKNTRTGQVGIQYSARAHFFHFLCPLGSFLDNVLRHCFPAIFCVITITLHTNAASRQAEIEQMESPDTKLLAIAPWHENALRSCSSHCTSSFRLDLLRWWRQAVQPFLMFGGKCLFGLQEH